MESTSVSFEQVAASLEARAAERKTITYNDLASELGLPPVNNLFSNSPLSLFFEQIDADDAQEQRPFRTAVVVLKSSGRPGSGFYRSLELHRRTTIEPFDEAEVWQAEISALSAYYDPSQPRATIQIELSHAQNKRLARLCEQSQRTPAALVQETLSTLLSILEEDFAAIAEAEAGPFLSHEEVFARIQQRFSIKL